MHELRPLTCRPPVVEIAGRPIGTSHAVYVIAEAGVNHNGDLATAKELIRAAKESGADAVKFQIFSAARLVAADAPTCQYQKEHATKTASQQEMLRRLELSAEQLLELKLLANQLQIDFLATPFGLPDLQIIQALGLPAIKIASPDIVNAPLLVAAARTNLPVIASTGAATVDEIEFGVRTIRRQRHQERLILLHCVSSYPLRSEEARLANIRSLAARFEVPVGFSDHTPEAEFSTPAVSAGACILEKHLTLSRAAEGPDHFFSLEPPDFARYVAAAHRAREMLGDGRIAPVPAEQEVRNLARGSIVAVHAMPAGHRIGEEDLIVQRPAGGIEPQRWQEIVGRTTRTDIPAQARLDWSMLTPDNS